MKKDELKARLINWGRWSREVEIHTGYPSLSAFLNTSDMCIPSSVTGTEKEVLEVEKAVCKLKQFDELGYEVIKTYYINNISLNKISKDIKRSKGYVHTVFRGAEMFIHGFLS
ncbi:antiterminator Q family protein [Pasteurella atlantica]|uniref:Antiterminator Q family protein n=2 Tax=Pasteurellaceae TaxID=712 RepID=A0ACC6HJN3_9PAST|nr:antiterminator Q family protein [Pasteurella atlantica]MDP8051039.1 antiterminator Q family protein [Pasteurella atlantica]MDP8104335.1 antiterminator Q family protein [Pasteurella atlantica]MDP8147695.1 antiterminator Q family protein [Pasteurella atlantica]